MNIALANERPVYVRFEYRAVEDRAASVKSGQYVAKDVAFAIITPPGGNLTVEEEVDNWLKKKERDQFFDVYRRQYEAWKDGHEIPEEGTPIRTWPPLGPAQIEACIRANIRTVEDLATAPEEAIGRIGMGARGMQQKAQVWLQSAQDKGKATEEISTLRRDVATLTERLTDLEKENAGLRALLPETAKPKRGRAAQIQDPPDTLEQALG